MSEHDYTTNPLVSGSQTSSAQELTAEELRELLHYNPDTGIFTWKVGSANQVKAGDVAGCQNVLGYLRIQLQSRKYLAHRLAWLYVRGEWPKDQLDHVNRVRTDNRITNLMDVSTKQNMQNAGKYSHNTSGHPGVYWYKRDSKWQARIMHNRKNIHLGYFTDIEEALAARKAGELKYWGHHRAD